MLLSQACCGVNEGIDKLGTLDRSVRLVWLNESGKKIKTEEKKRTREEKKYMKLN